jgi:hypothetical protein
MRLRRIQGAAARAACANFRLDLDVRHLRRAAPDRFGSRFRQSPCKTPSSLVTLLRFRRRIYSVQRSRARLRTLTRRFPGRKRTSYVPRAVRVIPEGAAAPTVCAWNRTTSSASSAPSAAFPQSLATILRASATISSQDTCDSAGSAIPTVSTYRHFASREAGGRSLPRWCPLLTMKSGTACASSLSGSRSGPPRHRKAPCVPFLP